MAFSGIGTISTNYLPKWNGTALTNSLIFDNGTNVGIGTSTPTRKFSVTGSTTNSMAHVNQLGTGDGLQVYVNSNSSTQNMFSTGSLGGSFYVKCDGDVGIGTSTPSEKLDVEGSTQVDGEYTYESAKTRYMSVSAAAFTPVDNNSGRELHVGGFNSGNARWIVGGNISNIGYMMAPVSLPHGAVITRVDFYVLDQDASYDVTGQMRRHTFGSSIANIVATTTSTSALPGTTTISNTSISHTIDNSTYSYYLRFETREASANLRIYGAKITYTVTQAE